MSGEFFSDHQYYTCTWRNNHHSNLEERTCKARSVRADAIEVDVWDSIVGLFANLKTLEKHLRIAQQEELAALDPKLEELSAVESMIFQAESHYGFSPSADFADYAEKALKICSICAICG